MLLLIFSIFYGIYLLRVFLLFIVQCFYQTINLSFDNIKNGGNCMDLGKFKEIAQKAGKALKYRSASLSFLNNNDEIVEYFCNICLTNPKNENSSKQIFLLWTSLCSPFVHFGPCSCTVRSTFYRWIVFIGSCNSSRGCGNCGKVLNMALYLTFQAFSYVEILWILTGEKSGKETDIFSRQNRRHFHGISTGFPPKFIRGFF